MKRLRDVGKGRPPVQRAIIVVLVALLALAPEILLGGWIVLESLGVLDWA